MEKTVGGRGRTKVAHKVVARYFNSVQWKQFPVKCLCNVGGAGVAERTVR